MKEEFRTFFRRVLEDAGGGASTPQLVRTSRVMLLLACITLPLFGLMHGTFDPTVVDPLSLRFGFAGLCALVCGLSYRNRWARTHLNALIVGLYYLLTTHFFLLLTWNRFDVNYVIGFFVILFCVGVVFITLRSLAYYCVFLAWGLFAVGLATNHVFAHTPFLLGAAVTIGFISLVTLNFRLKVTAALSEANRQLRQEIDERSQAEAQLRESETRYRLMAEYATDLITKHTLEGNVLYASPASRALLGYAPEELLGQSCYDLFHSDDAQAIRRCYGNLADAPDTMTFVYRIRKKDGAYIWFESTTRALRDLETGEVREFLCISRDISARKEAERLKDELVSTVSHELRTPLTSLRGFSELMLQRQFSPAKQREFLTIINNEALRLTNLINDFLDVQRIESGRQAYHFETLDLLSLLQESASIFINAGSPYVFCFAVAPQLPPVRGDGDRLRQVMANLLSNAVKFSPTGGQITIGACARETDVTVWVSDHGVGIPADALPKLFHKFFRVDNQETRSIGGTGLGLALVKNIIEVHGGRVWVESAPGRGSTFFFSLPIAIASLTPRLMTDEAGPGERAQTLQPTRDVLTADATLL